MVLKSFEMGLTHAVASVCRKGVKLKPLGNTMYGIPVSDHSIKDMVAGIC